MLSALSRTTFLTSILLGLSSVATAASESSADIYLPAANRGTPNVNATYDYVVIGGGTAGLVMAARLSEMDGVTVAVVEAGTYYKEFGNTSIVPDYTTSFLSMSTDSSTWAPNDWGFTTTAQTALGGTKYHLSRAKSIGGCTAFNALVYQRGTVQSYNNWATLTGDDDYKWTNFLPFFRKSMNLTTVTRPANATVPAPSSSAFASGNGPVRVQYPKYATPFGSWAMKGYKENGLLPTNDFTSGTLNGSQYMLATTFNGERDSSQGFLNDALRAGNKLTLYNNTMAQKINFNLLKKAVSVDVSTKKGATYRLYARNEIILSAGAFQSPQLLMVSGVGPKASLTRQGITVIADRPGVGQNMWDHIFVPTIWPVGVETSQSLLIPSFKAAATSQWISSRTGILSSTNLDTFAWEKLPNRTALSSAALSDLAAFPADWPEVEYVSGSIPNAGLPTQWRDYTLLAAAMVSPTSRGSVDIQSADINVQPLINPNWLSTTTDQEVAVAAFKRSRAIMNSKSIAPILTGPEIVPGAALTADADILAFIKSSFSTVWHPSCTCSMGKLTDPMAVLDSHARVYGVTGLRVVDASSFPTLPPGHPMSTIYALAEKIAADIKCGN